MDHVQVAGSRFSGTIEYIRLIDLVQVSCLAKMSHIIKVDSPGQTGCVYLDSGNVVHVESGDKIGEEGFFELLQWESGRFETLPLPEEVTVSINRPWEYLLIQAINLSKEKGTGEEGAPSAQSLSHSFWGKINEIGLTDLVQLACLDSVDRVIEISSETLTGTIHIRGGQVGHAQTGGLMGREAFFKILTADSGSFVTLPGSIEGDVTISVPWEHLLIEAMRFLDEASGVIDKEQVENRAETLLQKIQKKKMAEKIRLAMTADKETRTILMRDSNRMIQVAVISNPKITDSEVAAIAHSRQVDDEVLRRIAADKEWIRLYPIRLALASNPKTPVAIARKLVPTLNRQDLKNISSNKSISTVVANEARKLSPK
ncbi:conserved hypothetical protein [Syntrophobacter sp. SbD1]|nr:conserved hypothetical protein [Syntrophobacter sp. SbD1]